MPRRFRKDIVSAVCKQSSPLLSSSSATAATTAGLVSAQGIEYVLNTIGAGDQMSHDEIETLLREVGGSSSSSTGESDCVISADQMLDMLSNRVL